MLDKHGRLHKKCECFAVTASEYAIPSGGEASEDMECCGFPLEEGQQLYNFTTPPWSGTLRLISGTNHIGCGERFNALLVCL